MVGSVLAFRASAGWCGVAELWFDDVDSLLAARQSSERKASTEDEAHFVDHAKVAYLITEEHVVFSEAHQGKH